MKIITSWDDGGKEDIRIAELLLKYDLPGIFYIPNNCELKESEIKWLSDKGFIIGGHTFSHPQDLKLLTNDELRKEFKENKEWLESITGKKITDFCYPKGRYDDRCVDILKELGFTTARTVVILNTDEPRDKMRIKTSIHAHPKRVCYKGFDWFAVSKQKLIEAKKKENGFYHLWGHGFEITKFNLWRQLEELFKYIYENRN